MCENNDYSVYSHISKRQSKKRNILKIAKAIGIDGTKISGNDVVKIFNTTKKIIKKIKKKSKPHIILIDTFRHLEHCGPNNDDHLAYRSKIYVSKWLNNDPLNKVRKDLVNLKYLKKNDLKNIDKKINKEILSAFKFAEDSKFPSKKLLFEDIYAK